LSLNIVLALDYCTTSTQYWV